MSNAKKCDRCGLLYEPYGGVPRNPQGTKYDAIKLLSSKGEHCYICDLCFPCMKHLINWLAFGAYEGGQDNER